MQNSKSRHAISKSYIIYILMKPSCHKYVLASVTRDYYILLFQKSEIKKVVNNETRKQRQYKTTKVRDNESVKQRKYETTKVRKNENAKQRK